MSIKISRGLAFTNRITFQPKPVTHLSKNNRPSGCYLPACPTTGGRDAERLRRVELAVCDSLETAEPPQAPLSVTAIRGPALAYFRRGFLFTGETYGWCRDPRRPRAN